MSKQSPFFKFDVLSWLSGSIQLSTLEEKGLFTDLCAMYWKTHEPVQIDAKFKLRYRSLEGDLSDLIGNLSSLEVLVYNEGEITIPFLDELLEERVEFIKNCSKGGKKSQKSQGNSSNKKEERRKKIEESRDKKEDKREEIKDFSVDLFSKFRDLYPGTKEGLSTEYERFQKKHKDWKEILPLLLPAVRNQIAQRKLMNNNEDFVPHWKHLKTWINNHCWETEINIEEDKPASQGVMGEEAKERRNTETREYYKQEGIEIPPEVL